MTSTDSQFSHSSRPGPALLLSGVLLPALALGTELTTRMCGHTVFDPLPTLAHVALVASVPLVNGWVWIALRKGYRLPALPATVALGLSLGVCGYYALSMLPITPFAVIAILAMGVGLLALSPWISGTATALLWLRLRARGGRQGQLWTGVALGCALLVAAEAPAALQQYWAHQAVFADDEAERALGVERLRRWFDAESLQQPRTLTRGRAKGLLGMAMSQIAPAPDAESMQELHFRVTGVPWQNPWESDESGYSTGRGRLERRAFGLSLQDSSLDGSVATQAGVGYLEWTLVFGNDASWPHEARGEVALPRGGAVSRVSLWVDGEPREAAFAATGKAREAYERVVSRRRDPLLVTSSGPDRVSVRCFPVPGKGEMKIRLGITFPLQPGESSQASFALPHWLQSNFDLPDTLRHQVWLDSNEALTIEGDALRSSDDAHRLQGALTSDALDSLHVLAPLHTADAFARSPSDGRWVHQRHVRSRSKGLPHWVVVLDSSATMDAHASSIAAQLERALAHRPLTLVHPKDVGVDVERFEVGESVDLRTRIDGMHFVGGRPNDAALERATELAMHEGAPVILWLHGPQPLRASAAPALRQWLHRAGGKLVPLALESGPNRVVEQLADEAGLQPAPWASDPLARLAAFIDSQMPGYPHWKVERELASPEVLPEEPIDAGPHLARLWARDTVAAGCPNLGFDACRQLAIDHQLVTRLSGAVVLENAAQYAQAGLAPVDPNSVPAVPEPETWLLLIALATGGILLHRRARLTGGLA